MRVSKEQAAQNRQKILTAATRLFRERGISATGVDAITEAAGLTHGAPFTANSNPRKRSLPRRWARFPTEAEHLVR
jgi:hypothetical protein